MSAMQAQLNSQSQMTSPNKAHRKLKDASRLNSPNKTNSTLGGSNQSIMDAAAAAVGNMRRTKQRFFNKKDSSGAS